MQAALGDRVLEIDPVGSTAVPGADRARALVPEVLARVIGETAIAARRTGEFDILERRFGVQVDAQELWRDGLPYR
ncbi:MAG TPA: GrpB family protein [Candidatus Agrococcus pullicola]|uniref:GrpB family protein n=1 Tax=Candidatus Agrococcus pullicola TaxID=2838429 RepID=A0A9D2C7L9_9MICO|nr:GrpB family protein [Candidatus Agrococcus pullicola]